MPFLRKSANISFTRKFYLNMFSLPFAIICHGWTPTRKATKHFSVSAPIILHNAGAKYFLCIEEVEAEAEKGHSLKTSLFSSKSLCLLPCHIFLDIACFERTKPGNRRAPFYSRYKILNSCILWVVPKRKQFHSNHLITIK